MRILNLNITTDSIYRASHFFLKAPFIGGKARFVSTRLPFLAAGAGVVAILYLIARRIFQSLYHQELSRNIHHVNAKTSSTNHSDRSDATQSEEVLACIQRPPPLEAARERNKILMDLFNHINAFIDIFQVSPDFKNFLDAINLGLLATAWGRLEILSLKNQRTLSQTGQNQASLLIERRIQEKANATTIEEKRKNFAIMIAQFYDALQKNFIQDQQNTQNSSTQENMRRSQTEAHDLGNAVGSQSEEPQLEKIKQLVQQTSTICSKELLDTYLVPLRDAFLKELEEFCKRGLEHIDQKSQKLAIDFMNQEVDIENFFQEGEHENANIPTTLIGALSLLRGIRSLDSQTIQTFLETCNSTLNPIFIDLSNRSSKLFFKITPYLVDFLNCCSTVSKGKKVHNSEDPYSLKGVLKGVFSEKNEKLIERLLKEVETHKEVENAILDSLGENKHPAICDEEKEKEWVETTKNRLKNVLENLQKKYHYPEFKRKEKFIDVLNHAPIRLFSGNSPVLPTVANFLSFILDPKGFVQTTDPESLKKSFNQIFSINFLDFKAGSDPEKFSILSPLKESSKKSTELRKACEAVDEAYQSDSNNSPEKEEHLRKIYLALQKAERLKKLEEGKEAIVDSAKSCFQTTFSFKGPLIIHFIDEASSLLSHPKVLKHWTCTLLNLFLDEFEKKDSYTNPSPSKDGHIQNLKNAIQAFIDRTPSWQGTALSWGIWVDNLLGTGLTSKICENLFDHGSIQKLLDEIKAFTTNPQKLSKQLIDRLKQVIDPNNPNEVLKDFLEQIFGQKI